MIYAIEKRGNLALIFSVVLYEKKSFFLIYFIIFSFSPYYSGYFSFPPNYKSIWPYTLYKQNIYLTRSSFALVFSKNPTTTTTTNLTKTNQNKNLHCHPYHTYSPTCLHFSAFVYIKISRRGTENQLSNQVFNHILILKCLLLRLKTKQLLISL